MRLRGTKLELGIGVGIGVRSYHGLVAMEEDG